MTMLISHACINTKIKNASCAYRKIFELARINPTFDAIYWGGKYIDIFPFVIFLLSDSYTHLKRILQTKFDDNLFFFIYLTIFIIFLMCVEFNFNHRQDYAINFFP